MFLFPILQNTGGREHCTCWQLQHRSGYTGESQRALHILCLTLLRTVVMLCIPCRAQLPRSFFRCTGSGPQHAWLQKAAHGGMCQKHARHARIVNCAFTTAHAPERSRCAACSCLSARQNAGLLRSNSHVHPDPPAPLVQAQARDVHIMWITCARPASDGCTLPVFHRGGALFWCALLHIFHKSILHNTLPYVDNVWKKCG